MSKNYRRAPRSKRYNYEFLVKFCTENNLTLTFDYKNIPLIAHSMIQGLCKTQDCDGIFYKRFDTLVYKSNFYCRKCSLKIGQQRTMETSLKKYGEKYPSRNKEVKEKVRKSREKRFRLEREDDFTIREIKRPKLDNGFTIEFLPFQDVFMDMQTVY